MNSKIEELRNKAMEKYRYSDCDGDNNHGIRLNEEKFALLIIQECCRIVNLWTDEDSSEDDEDVYQTKWIKKTFGLI